MGANFVGRRAKFLIKNYTMFRESRQKSLDGLDGIYSNLCEILNPRPNMVVQNQHNCWLFNGFQPTNKTIYQLKFLFNKIKIE